MKRSRGQNVSSPGKIGWAHDLFLHSEKLFQCLDNHGGAFDALGGRISIDQFEQALGHPGVDFPVV
jgi:hypothetical protein